MRATVKNALVIARWLHLAVRREKIIGDEAVAVAVTLAPLFQRNPFGWKAFTATDIARQIDLPTSAVIAAFDTLQDAKLLRREATPDEGNRFLNRYRLTAGAF